MSRMMSQCYLPNQIWLHNDISEVKLNHLRVRENDNRVNKQVDMFTRRKTCVLKAGCSLGLMQHWTTQQSEHNIISDKFTW